MRLGGFWRGGWRRSEVGEAKEVQEVKEVKEMQEEERDGDGLEDAGGVGSA